MSKFFYGVRCEDQLIQSLFDLILIILAKPSQDKICQSHITLQGPYSQPKNFEDIVFDKKVYLTGISILETNRGAALVFKAEINDIYKIWNKPDFPDGIPHLTIFEGEIEEAEHLYNAIRTINKKLMIQTTSIQQINSKYMPAKEFTNYKNIKPIFELICNKEWPGPGSLSMSDHLTKIKYFKRIFNFISNLNSKHHNNCPSSIKKSLSCNTKTGSLI